MAKPFDVTKFRKDITKSIPGISSGFHDPTIWLSTGNYGLNYLISGDFYKGVPMGKVSIFSGEPAAGKSYIVSGNIVKAAQEQNIFVVLIDTENALDTSFLEALGVDVGPDKLLKLSVSMIDDVAKIISDFVEDYKKTYELKDPERPKVLFVIDSLGMLMSQAQVNQMREGTLKGDMGHKAKGLKALITGCTNMFGELDFGLVATNHSHPSQDQFNPDPIISGGLGQIFAASIVVGMKKLKLKEDENGNKITSVTGIRSSCTVAKTRYSKPFESIKINIPYDTGMNPISGLFDLFERTGKFIKQGNRYLYKTKDGGEMLYFRKDWNDFEKMKIVMDEFTQDDLQPTQDSSTQTEDDDE